VHHLANPHDPVRYAMLALLLAACSGSADAINGDADASELDAPDSPVPAPGDDAAMRPDVATLPDAADGGVKADAKADAAADAGTPCKKDITVVASVGTGAGALSGHSNGCWRVVDADGAANHSFRKCSTSSFQVVNTSAPSYAYDDTNVNRPLSEDQSFLAQCSQGATGDGYEYLAYRGGWRLLHASHLRAYFAELYGDAIDDVDSYFHLPGVYEGNAQLAAHAPHVFPMINIGPSPGAHLEHQIETDALALCKEVVSPGYFGTYNASWQSGMGPSDPRVLALAKALDACTTQ
jgi:hypothetical protein